MTRFATLFALCALTAGLAIASDGRSSSGADVIEIHVTPDEMSSCEATLRGLQEVAVYTDRGRRVLGRADAAQTVCTLRL